VNILSHQLEVYYDNKKVAGHKRSFQKHHWIVDIEHYLSTFKKKPGALPDSLALAGNVYLKKLYQQYFHAEPRNFIELLEYCRQNKVTDEKLEDAVSRLLTNGNREINIEKLRALLGNKETAGKQTCEDNIYRTSQQQLSVLTELMHQNN
jgi:hypothetical protein